MSGNFSSKKEESILWMSRAAIGCGSLVLVNRAHGLQKEGRSIELLSAEEGSSIYLEEWAARAFRKLKKAVCGGKGIVSVSGFRSREEQEELYSQSLAENGEEFTRQFVALPGHSEHETGLAIDVGKEMEEVDFICPEFPYEGVCRIFRELAPMYGFIERYPKGKESITGIAREPWHFRYVGDPHARIIQNLGMTLEEYHTFLKERTSKAHPYLYQAPEREFAVYYVPAAWKGRTRIALPGAFPTQVLGNNMDGFVVTVWRDGV